MIKYVVFDLDNTVYDYDYCHEKAMLRLSEYACKTFQISVTQFEQAFHVAKQKVKKQLRNTGASHNRMLYMQLFLEEVGENPVKTALDLYEVYWGTMLETMDLYPYVLPLMKALKERDIKIAVLTDLTAHIQHRKIKKLSLEEYIDVLVTSEEAGAEKPSVVAFEKLLKKCNVFPHEMLMIGDSLEKDVQGALHVGMHGILFEKEMSCSMDRRCMEYIDEQLDKK